MCPPAPDTPVNIGFHWSDEQICKSLAKYNGGSPLPDDVIADINPYQYLPSNLPDGIWFLVGLTEKRETELGCWKARGEACKIYANSSLTGLRTTLEFFQGEAPGQKTDWLMQEYKIIEKGPSENKKAKEPRVLCRIFLARGSSSDNKAQIVNQNDDTVGRMHIYPVPLTSPNTDSITKQGPSSDWLMETRKGNTVQTSVADGVAPVNTEDSQEVDYLILGDYLELDDLADPGSGSSSSANSSRLSLTSDEYFDSLALLRDIEEESSHELHREDTSFKLRVAASQRPNEVVLQPASLGSIGRGKLSSGEGLVLGSAIATKVSDREIPDHAVKRQKAEKRAEGTSGSCSAIAQSGFQKPLMEGEQKAEHGRMKKLRKKYLCFFPF